MDGQFIAEQALKDDGWQDTIDALAVKALQLGSNIVDVAGLLDDIAAKATSQRSLVAAAQSGADHINDANEQVILAARDVAAGAAQTLAAVVDSVDRVRSAGEQTREVATWVHDLKSRMESIETSLKAIHKSNIEITSIARQVNILAINAKIEASRAGEAGRGFAFLADAVKDLAKRTTQTAESIEVGIQSLSSGIIGLRDEAVGISGLASDVLTNAKVTDEALSDIPVQIEQSADAAREISTRAEQVQIATREFGPVFTRITTGIANTAECIDGAKTRANGLIDISESFVQRTVAIGADTGDAVFIEAVTRIANEISTAFETGISSRLITEQALFTRQYKPVPGSNPEQVIAPFTAFTDRVLPPIQEAVLSMSDSIVFCAAVDINGYLPTHNRKFSRPQGADPTWNTANCRNRRIFNDRVGLKAGRSTEPFLLQVYRRDMGGGTFVLMKDLSAPIFVRGRHWGGVRLAYKF